MAVAEGYSTPQVARRTGASYRQLDYWARTGILVPSVAVAYGSGTQRRYSVEDVRLALLVAAIARLGGRNHDTSRRIVEVVRARNDWTGFVVVDEEGRVTFADLPLFVGVAFVANLASIAEAVEDDVVDDFSAFAIG